MSHSDKIYVKAFLLFVLLLTACGGGFEALPVKSKDLPSHTESLDTADNSFIFNKNRYTANDVRTVSASLLGLDASNKLQNEHFAVMSVGAEQLPGRQIASSNLPIFGGRTVAEVQAYHYSEQMIKHIRRHYREYQGLFKKIVIQVNTNQNGWSPIDNIIRVGSYKNFTLSYDSSYLLQLFAQALLYHATDRKIYALGQYTVSQAACSSKIGCAVAIANGQADYLTSLILNTPSLGEDTNAKSTGLSSCGLSRNFSTQADLTLTQSFNACVSKNTNENAYQLGFVYGSIWWNVREKIRSNHLVRLSDFDSLFLRHLQQLESTDNFLTALNKAKTIDGAKYSGFFSSYLESEYQRRQ